MKVRKYKDFDEMFLKLNQEILTSPHEMLDYSNGILGYMDNVFIACKNWDCNLDLGKFGYKKNKWPHLLKTYINYDELLKFHERLATASGLSLTFYFNQKKINNGSCLLEIVLSRKDRTKKWDKCNVIYRTTETQRRMAADLCLINSFIRELPECCEIERVTFYMAQSYISAMVINGYFGYFGVDMNTLDKTHPWIKNLVNQHDHNFVPGARITTYQSMAKMQKLALGMDDCPSMLCKDLSIKDFFESRIKKGAK